MNNLVSILLQVADEFYWKGLHADVKQLCQHCDRCQRTNPQLQKSRAELHPIPVTKVWHRVGIDLVGLCLRQGQATNTSSPYQTTSQSGLRPHHCRQKVLKVLPTFCSTHSVDTDGQKSFSLIKGGNSSMRSTLASSS